MHCVVSMVEKRIRVVATKNVGLTQITYPKNFLGNRSFVSLHQVASINYEPPPASSGQRSARSLEHSVSLWAGVYDFLGLEPSTF